MGVCEVCHAVEAWKADGAAIVLLQTVNNGRGVCVKKATPQDLASPNHSKYEMQLSFAGMSSCEIRQELQVYLEAANDVWIELDRGSVKVR